MVKLRHRWSTPLLVALSVAVIVTAGISYIVGVQRSLWKKSVTDILEVTAQGRHALDTYISKDAEMIGWLAADLAGESSRSGGDIQSRLQMSGGTSADYLCVDLDAGVAYTGKARQGQPLEADQLAAFRALEGRGMREPYLHGYTGVWTIGYYQRFTFADGASGLVQKTQPLSELAERFSLSFYGDTGFSYVVDGAGDIMIRSRHRNSNRTFQNLFDIVDLQGNDPEQVRAFRAALAEGQQGVARFRYRDEEYVFCFVPMQAAEGWYVVSIVPDRVIMEQANEILQDSQVFLLLIAACVAVLAAFFAVYRRSTRRVLAAEEEARRAAESANAAKSQFLSNMSHDIRTPMNAIIGMTRLAADHADEPERVREYLKNISLSGQHLVGLINDILDMSKIESGKMALNNADTPLPPLMTDLVRIIQPMAARKGQKFDIQLQGVRHETLCMDALRMSQLMLNLLSNAVKYTPEGGAIRVDVAESPSRRAGRTHLTLRVSDNGIGMRPEFLEHLFDSFTREQDTRVNKIEGTGLGMAITKMIVDLMEGTISVESRPGQGSVFTVELDLLLPAVAVPEDVPALPPARVLFADDDPDTRRSVADFLRELGLTADVADSGRTAVDQVLALHAAGGAYDFILLDWKMPEMDGLQAVQAIRAKTGREVPVIILSAYDWAGIEAEALRAGVDGFIQKPLFRSTLIDCLRRYLLHEVRPTERRSETVDLTGKRVLLAEDNELNREIARELLASMGAQVEAVEDGQSCLRRFSDSPPGHFHLILMDIHMPVMDGYEATRHIRSLDRPDAETVPIFALTADAFAEDIQAAREAGMDSHLAKPLDMPAMVRELQKYLFP